MPVAHRARISAAGASAPGRPDAKYFCIDHDHTTKAVRGLLCFRCNTAIGSAGDNPTTLRNLATYLDRWHVTSQMHAGWQELA